MRATALVCLLDVLLVSAPSLAADWPGWRGPNGDGTSREQGLPLVWNEQLSLAWKADLPEWGTCTPAIWGDSVFVTSERDSELLLLKLDAKIGKTLWTKIVGHAETKREAAARSVQKFHRLHNNASPSPVTDGEVVVVHFGNGDLAAYDFKGRRLWKNNLQEKHGAYTIWWGHANSPVLHGNLVISVCMQDSLKGVSDKTSPSYLVAHDKRTGKEKWKSMRMSHADAEECDSYTTPLLVKSDDRSEVIVMGGNQLDAYDPADGHQLWFLPELRGGRTITGPTAADGIVYATEGMRGSLVAVRTEGPAKRSRRDIVWKQKDASPDTCCPVVWGGLLFTISDDGVAKCYDANTGHTKWKKRLRGDYKASPVAAEGRVYFLNVNGLTTVVAAGDRFEELASNQLDDETIASPAISDGRIYVRGRKHLYAIEKAPAEATQAARQP